MASLQLNPGIGSVSANIARADKLVQKLVLSKHKIDVLVLPELAFTGYNFSSRKAIEPYLEPSPVLLNDASGANGSSASTMSQDEGPTAQWAKATSRRLGCHTLVGYPEIEHSSNRIYNSALFTSPQGDILFNYRKRFLYSADEVWGASEGPDGQNGPSEFPSYGPFKSLANGKIKLQVGICMDLNPYKFEAPFQAFEFASAAANNDVSLILSPMAWLHPESPNIQEGGVPKETLEENLRKSLDINGIKPELSTVNYWLMRLIPIFSPKPTKNIGLVTCNRWGSEPDLKGSVYYAGSSSIFQISPTLAAPHIELKAALGQIGDDIIVSEVEVDETSTH